MQRRVGWYLASVPDLIRAWMIEPTVESCRLTTGPKPLISRLRAQGTTKASRTDAGRSRLRFAIALAERLRGRKPNCYRRVLMEIALDAGAAREPVFMGIRDGGGAGTGHAYLPSHPDSRDVDYDAVFAM
jgi:hypothetical protein